MGTQGGWPPPRGCRRAGSQGCHCRNCWEFKTWLIPFSQSEQGSGHSHTADKQHSWQQHFVPPALAFFFPFQCPYSPFMSSFRFLLTSVGLFWVFFPANDYHISSLPSSPYCRDNFFPPLLFVCLFGGGEDEFNPAVGKFQVSFEQQGRLWMRISVGWNEWSSAELVFWRKRGKLSNL